MLSNNDPWTPERRRALVLELIRGETSPVEAAQAHGLTTAQIEDWQRRFLRSGEEALRDGRLDRRVRVAVIAVVGLWLILRVAYWNGYYVEDAPGYVTDAVYFAQGDYRARDYVTGLNVGTYLPVAIPLRLAGKTEAALSVWPLLSSLLGLLSMIGLTRILLGPWFAVLAGLLYATYPGDIFFSTVVMPDAIQAGWLTCSIFLVASAYTGLGARGSGLATRGPSTYWRLGAGGVAMGVCHLIRANGPILVPIGLVAVLVLARVWKRRTIQNALVDVMAYLGGWLFVQVGEGMVYLWAAGDFLHRFHVVDRHYGTLRSLAQWGLNTDPTTIPFSIFPPLLWLARGGWLSLNHDQAYHGLIFCLGLGALAPGLILLRRTRASIGGAAAAALVTAAFWFVWPLFYHQYGSQSLTEFVPIHRLSRHLIVYAPGAVFATVAGVFVIREAASTWRKRSSGLLAAAGLLILSCHLAFNLKAEQIAFGSYDRIKSTYQRIRHRLPPDVRTIVGDPGDLCFFDFWLNPLRVERVRLVPFANYSHCEELPDGVLLTRSNPGWNGLAAQVIQETVARLPCLVAPPPDWRLLYDGYPEKIFVVDRIRGVDQVR